MERSRAKKIILWVLSPIMVLAGIALIASFLLAGRLDSTATNSEDPGGFNVPRLETTQGNEETTQAGPEDKTLKLTVPAMSRIEDDEIPSTDGGDEAKLKKYAAIHLEGTGFPWQDEANVYIAGHRLGYPRTDSFFVFWDLNKVRMGARVLLTDSENTKYVYEVFERRVVGPNEVSIKKPIEGKNIVSLQTCTLPNYAERLVVQAELVRTIKAPVEQAAEGGDLQARSD